MQSSIRDRSRVKRVDCKLALSSLFNNRSDIHVRVMSDNTTAVSYINAIGGGGGASHWNATPLLRKFGIGPLLETFGYQQPILQDLAMLMLISYLKT